MSNLYPQLMATGHGNGNGGGSFDDYDSIIDEFSIGCENSDISSMHMSDMAEIIIAGVAAANTAETIATTTTIPHDASPKGSEAIMPPPTPDADANDDDDHHNPDINDNHNDHHGVNHGYYYHVGDLYHVDSLGIDNTDMSAILGLASVSSAASTTTSIGPSSSVDAESLLPTRNTTRNHNGIEMEEDDQHSLPSVYAIKNDFAIRMTNNNSMQDEMTHHNDDEEDGMNQSSCVSKQLGPLGDELSYAENSVEYQHYDMYEPSNSDYAADYANDYLDEEEDDVTNHHRSILPNLITYSSRRSKCVTVFLTAFILGILVFAMVAVGVSYSSTGSINPFTSSSISTTINGNPSTGGIGGDGVEDGNNSSGSIDSIRLPLESDDEEKDVTSNNSSKQTTTTTTSRPTSSVTMSGTSTAEVDSFTALPTTSPRDDELDEKPIQQQQQQQQQQVMTLVPTTMPSELPSLLRRPSTTPTLSSNPTTQPSMSNVPSLVPTISSQPSWPVGNDSVMEGDARFYLMADGGGNLRFADRLESFPMGQHKFMVHL
jgi:hypothetical protein